jgi:3-hydroxyisobutyrate dehydrogenase
MSTTNTLPTVAFIGLGVMGYPMAGHLSKKGYATLVYNRNADKSAAWAKEHAGAAFKTPREAATGADIVCICVGNDDDLRSVVLGADGVLAGAKKGGHHGPHHGIGQSGH